MLRTHYNLARFMVLFKAVSDTEVVWVCFDFLWFEMTGGFGVCR